MDLPAVDDVALVKSVADDLPVAIWLGTVPGGEVVYVNRAFEAVLGMNPPEGAERGNYVAPYSVHTPDGAPYPENMMPYERVIRARDTVVLDDLVIHRGDRRISLRVYAKPLFDKSGTITHVLEAFHDISREVEAERARIEGEARLRQAQRMEAIGNLAGGIAHDFNNMLASIKILTAHLEKTEPDPSRLRYLGDIDSVVDTAAKLTHALLRFARRGQSIVEPFSISELVVQVGELGRRTIDRNIEIVTEVAENAAVLGDAGQIEQVLMNLVVNARDAMPAGGKLSLRLRTFELSQPRTQLGAGSYVEIEVEDSGTGIDPNIRDKVFDPYFTTKTSGPIKGTGLGLSTVYAIVRAHEGSIEIVDTLGGGTTMRVLLPRAKNDVPMRTKAEAKPSLSRRGTLLFVDDEPSIRRATSVAFEAIGYRVLSAEHGEAAIEIFRQSHAEIDAVVLDVVMPGMGGRAAMKELRAIDAKVPIVLTSGLGNEGGEVLPSSAFVAKPYSLDTMVETVERLRISR